MIDPKSMSISYQLAHVAYRARGLANAALASGAPPQTQRPSASRETVSASLLAVAAGGLARRRAYYYGIVYTTESRGSVWRDM